MGKRSGETWQEYEARKERDADIERIERESREQDEVDKLVPVLARALAQNLELRDKEIPGSNYYDLDILFAGEVVASVMIYSKR